MRKLLFVIPTIVVLAFTTASCNNDDTWDTWAEWREANNRWLEQQQTLLDEDGNLFYKRIVPEWNKSAYVLIHYFNDRKLTEGNLSPLYTSTVNVKYIGKLYNQEPFDSSYVNKTYGDSIFQTGMANIITGWTIALEDMRVGDSVRVVIPASQGYGTTTTGSIPPYSTLQFDIKLVDIPYYEIKEPQ